MSNRSTTGGPKVPYYPRGPQVEAAKHLRLTITRYLADRASMKDIREAMSMLEAAVGDQA